jgi:hypothetical protein
MVVTLIKMVGMVEYISMRVNKQFQPIDCSLFLYPIDVNAYLARVGELLDEFFAFVFLVH